MTEMGFTVNTMLNMTEQEVEDLIKAMFEIYNVELLVGEKYGIKSAIRAEKKHMEEDLERQRLELLSTSDRKRKLDQLGIGVVNESRRENTLILSDAVAPISTKDPLPFGQGHCQVGTSALLSLSEHSSDSEDRRLGKKKQKRKRPREPGEEAEDRPREHPFIVTEPGELPRGKKNGLDYLFDLYEQCGRFLEEVQQLCKERGEKCPMKVTNQVFRHAKHAGASYINKPKMRHYVHCYALHCLDVEHSNHLRKIYKDRGENVGAWRQACYFPLIEMARANSWDIEGVFNRNERLRIWYVPTRLRQLCHLEKSKECE
ncbi:hypothetical protein O6H91_13G044600 [Diphasiastrum complanatum]|uniref:Uncharacterized protein n=1 Tax=Diphasiastrum complanatum TaxID=34168 RepID=A0ACC2BUG2_DIPCM|nr:hypothetical protein O6H91_13G044600 [Diphasiastrum complanatum]